jgi:hypothetical protein
MQKRVRNLWITAKNQTQKPVKSAKISLISKTPENGFQSNSFHMYLLMFIIAPTTKHEAKHRR